MDYWRPVHHFSPPQTKINEGSPAANERWLAGMSGVALSSFEWIERSPDGLLRSMALSLETAEDLAPERLARFTEERAAFAGLSMARPQIMGIVNVTPDSFSDGGQFEGAKAAVDHGLRLLDEGASILDIGGESTRPGAETVPVALELSRVIPVIEGLVAARPDVILSIDTRKAEVMRAAVAAGAAIVNDVSALTFDREALGVVAALDVPVILMHAQGTPSTMQDQPTYDNVCLDVYDWLAVRMKAALEAGIKRENIALDPGIGFGKTLAHNQALLDHLSLFHGLGAPLLLGCSRKRFIASLDREAPVTGRMAGSLAGTLKGASQAVQMHRVHDVGETRQALAVWFGAAR